ncbi:hypothetical protein PUN28_004442 [Cardiocondyla obscurior]|uniref:Uncharacterized protein n=1 Tax=Cardiocondyla obscurior TaxID=286306 RepID=A0AAW2GCP7_9HYME
MPSNVLHLESSAHDFLSPRIGEVNRRDSAYKFLISDFSIRKGTFGRARVLALSLTKMVRLKEYHRISSIFPFAWVTIFIYFSQRPRIAVTHAERRLYSTGTIPSRFIDLSEWRKLGTMVSRTSV